VDILRLEHGATLLVPLLFAQAVLDAPLAIPQPFLYQQAEKTSNTGSIAIL
jgi:hypothetical protein